MTRTRAGAAFRLFVYLLLVAVAGTLLFIWNDLQEVRQVLARAEVEPVPPLVTASFVAAEDPDFFQHSRFYTLQALARETSNASLAEQLVRWHVHGRAISRLAREVIICAVIEITQPKETVARAYATNVYLGTVEGEHLYGVEPAARAYFGREPRQLSLEQAASLAATARSPTLFSPSATSDGAVTRRIEILQQMLRAGAITQAQYDRAKRSNVTRGIG